MVPVGSKRGGAGAAIKPVPPAPDPVKIPDPGDGGRVYIESEMGRPVRRDPASAAPSYPDFLQKQGIEGTVAVEYIVDTTGLADSASLRILRTTHPAFAEAVRAALPGMRFEPGEVGGQLVRQLVTQEFRFIITGQTSPATRYRRTTPEPLGVACSVRCSIQRSVPWSVPCSGSRHTYAHCGVARLFSLSRVSFLRL